MTFGFSFKISDFQDGILILFLNRWVSIYSNTINRFLKYEYRLSYPMFKLQSKQTYFLT